MELPKRQQGVRWPSREFNSNWWSSLIQTGALPVCNVFFFWDGQYGQQWRGEGSPHSKAKDQWQRVRVHLMGGKGKQRFLLMEPGGRYIVVTSQQLKNQTTRGRFVWADPPDKKPRGFSFPEPTAAQLKG